MPAAARDRIHARAPGGLVGGAGSLPRPCGVGRRPGRILGPRERRSGAFSPDGMRSPPGTEWFDTTIDEVDSVVRFVQPTARSLARA